MTVDMKQIGIECAMVALAGVVGFGGGCITGMAVKGPHSIQGIVPIVGAVYAISSIAAYALNLLVKHLAVKFDWTLSATLFTRCAVGAALTVATAVALFSVGIFGPIALGVTLGLGLTFGCASLAGIAIYLLAAKKDLSYSEARKSEDPFYKFALAC